MTSKYDKVKNLNDSSFKRLTGVKKQTFATMLKCLNKTHKHKKARGGRKNKLSVADMLLLALEYLREYRTYFHIAQSYEISESTAYKTIRFVEDTLIKHSDFSLPGKKALINSEIPIEVIVIDATETPIQRPKKNKSVFTQGKSEDTLLRAS
tara:strand:- start:423 stop:878 length:456 start_codon:yes stop_codon:yes gene_type:complete